MVGAFIIVAWFSLGSHSWGNSLGVRNFAKTCPTEACVEQVLKQAASSPALVKIYVMRPDGAEYQTPYSGWKG